MAIDSPSGPPGDPSQGGVGQALISGGAPFPEREVVLLRSEDLTMLAEGAA